MKIGIIAAMSEEAYLLQDDMEQITIDTLGGLP